MRDINQIIVHCSSTKWSMDIGAKEIRKWHTQENGWSDIGYHWVIRRNGTIEPGRDEKTNGAHARGYNSHSIGICMVGGLNDKVNKTEANYTFQQYTSLDYLVKELRSKYPISEVLGHKDLPGVAKDCPCFNVQAMFKE